MTTVHYSRPRSTSRLSRFLLLAPPAGSQSQRTHCPLAAARVLRPATRGTMQQYAQGPAFRVHEIAGQSMGSPMAEPTSLSRRLILMHCKVPPFCRTAGRRRTALLSHPTRSRGAPRSLGYAKIGSTDYHFSHQSPARPPSDVPQLVTGFSRSSQRSMIVATLLVCCALGPEIPHSIGFRPDVLFVPI